MKNIERADVVWVFVFMISGTNDYYRNLLRKAGLDIVAGITERQQIFDWLLSEAEVIDDE